MKNVAKNLTLAVLAVCAVVGIVGCFLVFFDMEKYSLFIKSYTPMYSVLIVSIGTKSVVDKIKETKE